MSFCKQRCGGKFDTQTEYNGTFSDTYRYPGAGSYSGYKVFFFLSSLPLESLEIC